MKTAKIIIGSLGFLLGIFLALTFNLPATFFWLPLPFLLLFWYGRKFLILLFFLGLSIGLTRGMLDNLPPPPSSVAQYHDTKVKLVGDVSDFPDVRVDSVKLKVKVVTVNDESISGLILVNLPRLHHYHYGDRLTLIGKLKTPSANPDFNYQNYLARFGITQLMSYPQVSEVATGRRHPITSTIFHWKGRIIDNLNYALGEPDASLAAGLLLGVRGSMSTAIEESFVRTGLTHIVAISGTNITILITLLGLFTRRLPRRVNIFIVLIAIAAFVVITGGSASVVRAAIMGGIGALVAHAGRQNSATIALALATVAMTLFIPKMLLYDVGFLLSVAATLGIIYLYPLLNNFLTKIPNYLLLRETLALTLAANLAVLPLIAINFGHLSLVSPLSNLLVAPIVPLGMIAGAIIAVIGFLSVTVATFLSYLLFLPLRYIIVIADLTGSLPHAIVETSTFSWPVGLLYYCLLITATYYGHSRSLEKTG